MGFTVQFNKIAFCDYEGQTYEEITQQVENVLKISKDEFYFTCNGKLFNQFDDSSSPNGNILIHLRTRGGKGGFGSMLRAIGAQIEKTTNKEACRDLSGRRLRDINEEKKLKAWLEKQKERDEEAKERKKRKLEKLTTLPKHEFKDAKYENARSELTEKVNEAVEEGFKKAQILSETKKKVENTKTLKKKTNLLWIGDDLSSGSDSESESEIEKKKPKLDEQKCVSDAGESSLSSDSCQTSKSTADADDIGSEKKPNSSNDASSSNEASSSKEDSSKI